MKKDKLLTAYECYQAVGELGKSQGSYSRLYATLTQWYEENAYGWEKWEAFCEDSHFTSVLDLVLSLEC